MIARRGIALIMVLIMTSLLFVMVLTLITLFRGDVFSSQSNYSRVSALYLAEAGVAESLLALEGNAAWPGVTNQAVPGIQGGGYTVDFAAADPELCSVNNLSNAGWGTSYHGANSVPPFSVLLVVQANVNGVKRILEVVATRGTAVPSMSNPVLASGRVLLGSNVNISGVTSLTDHTPVPAGIHSNLSGNVPDAIVWTSVAGDSAVISGKVSTRSTSGTAINMPGATIAGGTETSAAPEALPNIDIVGSIAAKSASPPPVINGSGVTTLTAGDYYHEGDLTVNGGDLKLQGGANLYVSGNLTVNGTITGTGSVYVGDETRFKGDAHLTSQRSDKNVAVFSHGSLFLEGFNGTDFLNGLAATDPTLGQYWSESKTVLAALQSRFNSSPQADLIAGGLHHAEIDSMRRSLAQAGGGAVYGGTSDDLYQRMARHLETNYPSSTARDFMITKFDDLDRFYDGKWRIDNATDDNTIMTDVAVRDDWDNQSLSLYGGWFDNMIDYGITSQFGEMAQLTTNIDYNNVGSAYFQGMVYTNGFVHASNGVTVTGVVVARDDGSQGPAVINGETLRPGDLFFDNDCKVTFVQDLYDGSGYLAPSSELSVTTWLGR